VSDLRSDTERTGPRSSRLVVIFVLASIVFSMTTLEAANDPVAGWEFDLFTAVNDLPDWLYFVIWPFMQYGVFVTIPIATVIAWFLGRRRLAVLLGVSGVSIYLLAKVVKRVVDRGRPNSFLEVAEREHFAESSIGYTSGHVAVAATIATLTIVHLPRPFREITVALVFIVMFGRMYVGAHLPLDMVGGAAMGIAAGTFAMLVDRLLARGPTTQEEKAVEAGS
jgi:membrane-associated phospholipid phosphatase